MSPWALPTLAQGGDILVEEEGTLSSRLRLCLVSNTLARCGAVEWSVCCQMPPAWGVQRCVPPFKPLPLPVPTPPPTYARPGLVKYKVRPWELEQDAWRDWEIPKAREAGEFQRPLSLLEVPAQGTCGYRREEWNVAYFFPCSAVLAKLVEIHKQT